MSHFLLSFLKPVNFLYKIVMEEIFFFLFFPFYFKKERRNVSGDVKYTDWLLVTSQAPPPHCLELGKCLILIFL